MHSVATQNTFGEDNEVIICNVEFWPLVVNVPLLHTSRYTYIIACDSVIPGLPPR